MFGERIEHRLARERRRRRAVGKPAVMPTFSRQRGTTFRPSRPASRPPIRSGMGGRFDRAEVLRRGPGRSPRSRSRRPSRARERTDVVARDRQRDHAEHRAAPVRRLQRREPVRWPGPVIEPPVCVPSEQVARRAAVQQPEPPDEPLGLGPGSFGDHALRVVETPVAGSRGRPPASGPIWSLPSTMPPAASDARDGARVHVRHEVREDQRLRGGEDALRVEVVLHRHRDAVQRPDVMRNLSRAARGRARLVGEHRL